MHSTLRKGFEALGYDVTLVSAGCIWDCPRDIDLSRNMRLGMLSGLKVIWKILANLRLFIGNDIVQMNDFHTLPLKLGWNTVLVNPNCIDFAPTDNAIVSTLSGVILSP